ncbi:MAG: hypothetical protein Q4C88_08215, partial [Akkermansia sp.]|nr:hypothetical protein [Akkermansia sp.]
MKLHLNATLRAALIAAITAVGMAMPQTFAESKALTVNPTEKTGGNVNMSWTGGDTTLNSWLLTFDLKVTNSGAANFFAISTNNSVSSAGWDLGINGTNLLLGYNGTGSPVVTLTDAYTLNTAQAVTFQFVRDVDEDGASLGTGTFTVTANGQTGTYKVDSLTDTALVSGSKAHIWCNGNPGKQQMTNITLTQLDDNKVVVPTSVWTGTDGNNTWEAGNFDPEFAANGNVKFTADGFDTVVVNSAVSAGKMSVEGAAYTFEIEDGGSLAAAKANIADGASLTVVGGGTATITSLSGAGDLTVGEGGTATVNGQTLYTGTMGVQDGGTLNLGSAIVLSELTVADGTVTTQHASGSGVVTNTLSIGEGGTFKVIGSHDAFGYNAGATKEIVMEGTEDAHATLALEQNSTNSVTMTTNIAMHGYSDITVKEGGKGFNTYGCNITVDGVENSIAVIDLRNAVSINVGKGELSVGKFTRNGTNTGAVTKTGAGIMTIEEASTLPGALNINEGTVAIKADTTIAGLNIATTGSLTVAGGTTSVSGSTNVIGNVIDLEAGTLSLAGAYDINSLSSSSEPRYIGGDGIGEGSGFKEASGVVQVVNITAGATLTQVEGVTFTYGADSGTLNEQGAFELSGAVDYTTLYVNNAEPVSYTSAWDLAQGQGEEISSVVLANGTTIDADMEDASIALSLTGATGTVNATEATTISSVSGWSGNKLIITGGANVSLTPGRDIVIGAGSSLEVGTAVAAQKIQLNGDGANLTVAAEGELSLSNNLTLTNGVADVYGTLNVGHEVDLSNGSKATGTLHIHDGGEVTAKDGMWMAPSAAGVLLDENATFAITGKGVIFTGKEGGNGSIKASGAEVNYTANNASAAISNVTMTATADITIGNTLTNVDVYTGEHAVSLNAAADSVTVGTDGSISFGTSGSASSITVEDGGAIGSYTKTNEGETTITSVGTAILADTINLQTGKITMTGAYNIDSLYGDVEITGYEGGTVDGNGFAHETGTVQVVDITEGAELDSDSATFLRGGSELTLTDGATTVDGTNYAGFYINSGEETLTQAKSEESAHGPLSFIYVKDGGTLQVDDDMDGELVYGEGTGIVNIQEDKTVTGAMEGVTLAGKGTYDLGSTASLGTGTTLGQDWMGVVSLSNLTKADGNSAWISGLAQGDSWVEFSNFTGYDRAWASSFVPAVTANIILKDDGEHAAWNLTAYASSTYTMVISGDVKGDGTFKTSGGTAAQSQAIEFRGDISEWEGAFEANANGMRRVVFTGKASTVNASITKAGAGALNLVVGNGSDPFDAVFHEEVSVTSVDVKANASATFLEQLTTSTVTNAGSVVFNTLEGLSQTITNSGDVTFNADFEVSGFHVTAGETGFYGIDGQFSVDGNGYAGSSASYITIVNGGSVEADGIEVTQEGTVYTINNSGRALADDADVQYDTFYVNTDTVDISAIAADEHYSQLLNIHVQDGGTLNVDQSTDAAIHAGDGATVAGDKAQELVKIAMGETVTYADGLKAAVDDSAEFSGNVQVTNAADESSFSVTNQNMVVQADALTFGEGATDTFEISCAVDVDTITNRSGQDLVLNTLVASELDGVSALSGDIALVSTQDELTINNLVIEAEQCVKALKGTSGAEITVTVTDTLVSNEGTLLANLVMEDDSAYLAG